MSFPSIWLGSDESFSRYVRNVAAYQANRQDFLARESEITIALRDSEDEDLSLSDYLAAKMVEVVGNVGLVRISGSLVSEESYFNLWYGDTAYSTIATAVSSLLADPNVSQILTVWDTPGGDASGIYDLGTFLKDARKVKPVHAWTGTMALSAGYWGAAACQSVRASSLGETGSIGAVAKFRSWSRALQEEGIDTLVARSAPLKALLQQEEPLDEKKQAFLQEKVDKLHTYFVGHLKQARAKLSEQPEGTWATGASFYADDAIRLGLVDGPEISLSALVSKLQDTADKAKAKQSGGYMSKNVVLSDQMVAQLMSGVAVPGVALSEPETEAPGTEDTVPVETPDAALSEAETPVAVEAKDPGLTAYLSEKVATLEGKLLELALKAEKAEAALAEAKGLEEMLRPVAIEATQRLQVALGQTPQPFTDIPSRTVAGVYRETLTLLEKRLPSGRQSVQGQDETRQARSLAELRLVSSAG